MLSKKGMGEAFRFACVGGVGFVIDAGILFLFAKIMGFNPFIWRLFSFLVASIATWLLHRKFTFRYTPSSPFRQWVRFVVFNGIGGGLNFLVYSLLLIYGPPPLYDPMVAVVISSVLAYVYNFTVSKYFVFSRA